jgi:beta-glucosidase
LKRSDFGPDFVWGTATASYQIEGAVDQDGRGKSIWDTFSHKKGAIKTGENGDIACDFYHRYEQDLELLKSMNFKAFRFSISWSRIFPDGKGKVNEAGLDFYRKLTDKCLSLGIEPWVTLFHWDLPQALEDDGGWTNRAIVDWFSNYVDTVTKALAGRVKHWMVLNEPVVFTAAGYFAGIHAPGRKGLGNFLPAVHHAALAQAEGGRIIRRNVPGAQVGTTFSCAFQEPATGKAKDKKAAARFDAIFNRLFIEPALGMGYPVATFPTLGKIEKKYAHPGDMERLKFDFDFIGIQNYTREIVEKSLWPPIVWAKEVEPAKRGVAAENITDMGWEVAPDGIYKILKQFAAYKGVKKIVVTENGAAFPDRPENGAVHDARRIQYFQSYLENVLRAQRDGMPVKGYFVWSLTDNFEWAEGYRPRFGLIYLDFPTQQRMVKDSGRWWQQFLGA